MKEHKLIQASMAKKLLINQILFEQSSNCRREISINYTMKCTDQIFSVKFVHDRIFLDINLNFHTENIFIGYENSEELSILFRAHFIKSYIQCYDSVHAIWPKSYFEGLVVLSTVNDLYQAKKVVSFSTFSDKNRIWFRPVDIYCSILALEYLLIDYSFLFTKEEQKKCRLNINYLKMYEKLPEIEYKGRRHPVYCLFEEMKAAEKIFQIDRGLIDRCIIFSKIFNGTSLNLSDREMLSLCESVDNSFWIGVAIRLIFWGRIKMDITDLSKNIAEEIILFRENCVLYFNACSNTKNYLLADNLLAIQKIARRVDQFIGKEILGSVTLHYIQ